MAYILSKALGRTKFVYFREKMGMVENAFQYKKQIVHFLRGSCIATISSDSAMGNMMQHIERELQYRCNNDSGSVMGSSTVAATTQCWWRQHCGKEMLQKQSNMQLDIVARAHSSLRGS